MKMLLRKISRWFELCLIMLLVLVMVLPTVSAEELVSIMDDFDSGQLDESTWDIATTYIKPDTDGNQVVEASGAKCWNEGETPDSAGYSFIGDPEGGYKLKLWHLGGSGGTVLMTRQKYPVDASLTIEFDFFQPRREAKGYNNVFNSETNAFWIQGLTLMDGATHAYSTLNGVWAGRWNFPGLSLDTQYRIRIEIRPRAFLYAIYDEQGEEVVNSDWIGRDPDVIGALQFGCHESGRGMVIDNLRIMVNEEEM